VLLDVRELLNSAPFGGTSLVHLIFIPDLRCSGHVDSGVQEVAEVLSELAGGPGQVLGRPPGRLDHLVGGLVETGSHLVELSLDLLEAPPTGRELEGGGDGHERGRRRT